MLFVLCSGVLAWAIAVPKSVQQSFTLLVSNIRGKLFITGVAHPGLVDDLSDYVDTRNLPQSIRYFYEQTSTFTLTASVQ